MRIFTTVITVCTAPPKRTEKQLSTVKKTIIAIAISSRWFVIGRKLSRNVTEPIAYAAIEPGEAIQNLVHPKRKPVSGPYASRKKTYSPPAAGNRQLSSAYISAPKYERTPAISHA